MRKAGIRAGSVPLGSHGGSARPVLGTLAGPSLLDLSSWAGAQRRKEGLCPHPGQNAFQGRHQALRCLAVEKGRWAPKPVLPQTDGLGAGTAGPAWLCCCLKILFEGAPRLCPAESPEAGGWSCERARGGRSAPTKGPHYTGVCRPAVQHSQAPPSPLCPVQACLWSHLEGSALGHSPPASRPASQLGPNLAGGGGPRIPGQRS